MSNPLSEARQLFQSGHFGAALDLAASVRKSSKDFAAARNLIANCHYNIGVGMVSVVGDMARAEESFRTCLLLVPHHEDANNNLAGMLVMRGEIAQAIPYYQATLKVNPRRASTLLDLAVCHERLDQLDEAARVYGKLAAMLPQDGVAAMRDALLVASIVPDRAALAASRQRAERLLDAFMASGRRIAHPERGNGSNFYFSYHGLSNRALNCKVAAAYLQACPALAWQAPHVAGWKAPSGRIRIGIVSEHLFDHSIGQTSRGIVAQLDREQFEVVVVHLGTPRPDAVHEAINRSADSVVYAGTQSLQASRETIAALGLDLLFWQDVGMSPFSYFLAFARLAPVQITSFGHPDTTGIPALDAFVSSALYEPAEDAQDAYSERLLMLPGAGTLSYYHRPGPAAALARPHFGLSGDDHVYICPQTLFKIHPDMDDLFAKILQRDAHARFVLIEPRQSHLKAGIVRRIGASHPDVAARLVFIPRIADQPTYKALLACADAMLDTVHFNGQNTNLEAFSVGLPVVTLPGGLQRARHTLGMYRAMEFLDLVADTPDAFAELAVRLATDAGFASNCRARIAERCGVLYDNADVVRHLGQACVQLVRERASA